MSTQEKTMLTKASGYNVNRILFSKPQIGNVPNSTFTFKRINISTKNPDGSVGELILPTERCFSFGIQENLSIDKKTVNGYVLPICLYTKDAPTKAEKEALRQANPGYADSWYKNKMRNIRKQRTADWVKSNFNIEITDFDVADSFGISYYANEVLTKR